MSDETRKALTDSFLSLSDAAVFLLHNPATSAKMQDFKWQPLY
jgi:hypothetical protein